MKTDLELRQDVERELSWDPMIDAANIAVTAKNGVVTLSGQVKSYGNKYEAVKDAKRVSGITGIADDMKVVFRDGGPSDTELTERVLNALKWNASVPVGKVTPVVRDGWVTLEGTVMWYYQKSAADGAVRYLSGVKGVTNAIVIDNPVVPQDVSKKITAALTRNARMDAHQVKVDVTGHTATLSGSVRSLAEFDDASAAAWSAPGVNSVQNNLTISY